MSGDRKVVRRQGGEKPETPRRNPFVDPPAAPASPQPQRSEPSRRGGMAANSERSGSGSPNRPRREEGSSDAPEAAAPQGERRDDRRRNEDRPPRRDDRRRDDDRDSKRARPDASGPEAWPSMRPSSEPHARLAHDDLLAIASMDPAEIAKLLDVSAAKSRVTVGMRITAKITRVGQDNVFVDVGAKSEAMLPREDLPDAKVGDEVSAYVIAADEGGIQLTQKLSGATAAAFVEEARHAGVPIEGRVASRNAGGYEVRIGSVRAFCPTSQIDRFVTADPDSYIGQTLEFKVVESGDNVIVSRRAMLEADLESRRAKFWMDVAIGQVLDGFVSSVQPFGIFVDLDGVDGLVPKREVSWDENEDAMAAFKRGLPIRVRVVDIDFEARKLTLSARDPAASPWTRVGTDVVEGGTYPGTVIRVAPYGAFIELGGGLQGLLHASRAGKSGLPREGAKMDVKVTGIDRERQRLELTAADYLDAANVAPETPGALVKATIQSVKGNGLEVEVEDGSTGWIDAREIDLPSNTVLAQRFRAGREIQARVVQFDMSRRHYKLSLRLEEPEKEWKKAGGGGGGQPKAPSLGTFADLFAGFKPKK